MGVGIYHAITIGYFALVAGGGSCPRRIGTPRDGRLVMAGFSGGIGAEDQPALTPRAIGFGNFLLGGVMLAYHDGPTKLGAMNLLPRVLGESIEGELLRWLDAGRRRPIVGPVASLREFPAELERLERRTTIGRSVLDWRR